MSGSFVGSSFQTEALLEAIDASASVHELLLAGIEGMALGADINLHFRFGGTGLERLTAYAANDALAVLGMDLFLHCCFTSFAYAMIGFTTASGIVAYLHDECKRKMMTIARNFSFVHFSCYYSAFQTDRERKS